MEDVWVEESNDDEFDDENDDDDDVDFDYNPTICRISALCLRVFSISPT